MPSSSEKQRKFFGAELARKKAGGKAKTDMSAKKLKEYASKPIKKVMGPVGGMGMQPTPKASGGSPVSASRSTLSSPRSAAAKHKASISGAVMKAPVAMETPGAPKVPTTPTGGAGGAKNMASMLRQRGKKARGEGGAGGVSPQAQEAARKRGLEAQSGDPEHPVRWVKPGDVDPSSEEKTAGAVDSAKVDSENRLIEDQRPDLNYLPEPKRPSMGDSMTEEQKQLQAADREGFMDNRQAAIKEVDPNPDRNARADSMDPREMGDVYAKMSAKEKEAVDKYLPSAEHYKNQKEYGNKKTEVDKKNQEIKDLKHPMQDSIVGDVRQIQHFDPQGMTGIGNKIDGVTYTEDDRKEWKDMSPEERAKQHIEKKGDYENKEKDLNRLDELEKEKESGGPTAEEKPQDDGESGGPGPSPGGKPIESKTGLENIQDPEVQELNTELNTARNTSQQYERANRDLDRRRARSTDPNERELIRNIQNYNNDKQEEQKGIIERIMQALMAALQRFMEEMGMSDSMPTGTPPTVDPTGQDRKGPKESKIDPETGLPEGIKGTVDHTRKKKTEQDQETEPVTPKGPQRRRTPEEEKAWMEEMRRRGVIFNSLDKSLIKMNKDYPFLMLSSQKDYMRTANIIKSWMNKEYVKTGQKD